MHLERLLALTFTALFTVTAATPDFGSTGQQVVGAVQDAGQHIVTDTKSTALEDHLKHNHKTTHGGSKKKKNNHKKFKKHHRPNAKKLKNKLVHKRLVAADIIPDIIDDFTPSFLLNVTYPNKHSPFLGQHLKNQETTEAPIVTLYPQHGTHISEESPSIPINNIVITLTDPDAPSRKDPAWGEVCHWIAIGLPVISRIGEDARLDQSVILKDVMPYKAPAPPKKTRRHRYVMLAFTPANATTEPLDLVKPADRHHWGYERQGEGVKRWANEMGLVPIAAEFFEEKYSH